MADAKLPSWIGNDTFFQFCRYAQSKTLFILIPIETPIFNSNWLVESAAVCAHEPRGLVRVGDCFQFRMTQDLLGTELLKLCFPWRLLCLYHHALCLPQAISSQAQTTPVKFSNFTWSLQEFWCMTMMIGMRIELFKNVIISGIYSWSAGIWWMFSWIRGFFPVNVLHVQCNSLRLLILFPDYILHGIHIVLHLW